MKASPIIPTASLFQPRLITLTFETQAELDAFASLANTIALRQYFGSGLDEMWQAATALGGVARPDFYRALWQSIRDSGQ